MTSLPYKISHFASTTCLKNNSEQRDVFKKEAKQNFPPIVLKSGINSVWHHIISVDGRSEKEI